MGYRIDKIDERVIYRLTENARYTSAPDIADEFDVTDATIRNRINRLENNGIIRGYHAAIDYEQTGDHLIDLFICTTNTADRRKLAKQALQIPGVVNVREVLTGRGDLHIKAVGTDTDDLARIAQELSNLGMEIEHEELLHHEHHVPYQPFGPEETPSTSALTDFLSLRGGAEVVELTVSHDAPITEYTLAEANDHGLLNEEDNILMTERDGDVITPRGPTQLQPGDVVRVFSSGGVSPDTIEAFSSKEYDQGQEHVDTHNSQ
ncbi:Lrp/AsnC family transcriptional regulator [Saliphagus sp. LR7]|uniref:Lrp/AsnC family transcriptional regulator n=1 Tax=Saliphagus sp. LR7 TaxID=2282654 RepID=UPI000DF739AB|nr:Lrp/AsnC family transcriptional regulator [Saliphagus sp. LR7]